MQGEPRKQVEMKGGNPPSKVIKMSPRTRDKAAKDTFPFSYGKRAGEWSRLVKVAVMGKHSTGKTTWGIQCAAMFPDTSVLILNTEPLENLHQILDVFPDVRARTLIVPDVTQQAWIDKRAAVLDGKGYDGKGIALCEFFLDYINILSHQPEENLKKLFIIMDTASYVRKRLGQYISEAIALKDSSVVNPSKGQLNYGRFYQKFNHMMERLMKLPCHTVVTARVEHVGKYTEDGYKDIEGAEKAEWGDDKNLRATVWYDAAMIIHLHAATITLRDESKSDVRIIRPDRKKDLQMQVVRWGLLKKWKAKCEIPPLFYDFSPEAIFKWVAEHQQ